MFLYKEPIQWRDGWIDKEPICKKLHFLSFYWIFLKLQSKLKVSGIFLLKFEKNPDFLAFFTKVIPKLTYFWHFFTKVELFFVKNETKDTFFPFLTHICKIFSIFMQFVLFYEKNWEKRSTLFTSLKKKWLFYFYFLLKMTYFY